MNWRKSSYSGGNGGGCVEVAARHGERLVRDSKQPDGGVLRFTTSDLAALIEAVKDGELDR